MNTTKILITGIGATPALCAAESLKLKHKKEIVIVGTDSNSYAAGMYLKQFVDYGIVVPSVSDGVENYLKAIENIVHKYNIDFILPASDAEIVILKKNEYLLAPASVIASDSETLETCIDKWLTYEALKDHNLMVESWLIPTDVSFPCIIKPRQSQGSKDVFVANNENELEALSNKVRKPIFQKMLKSDEYTIDCIFDREGEVIGAVPRRRIAIGGGTAIITETVRNDSLIDIVKRLSKIMKFKGQINVQCIQDKIIEINPRVGGASILSTYSGINMPAISLLLWKKKRVERWYTYKHRILTRYYSAICLDETELKRFK